MTLESPETPRGKQTGKHHMESSPQGRCGDITSDVLIILITAAQLVFFVFFHRYIAWPATGPDGSVTRLSLEL